SGCRIACTGSLRFWVVAFFFSSRRRHTRSYGDWSSDVCSSDLSTSAGREDADWEEVLAACSAAGVDAFATGLPDGYDTLIGEREIGRASCRERVYSTVGVAWLNV